MATAPTSIDRYLIEAVIGEGGMGRVYRASDPRLGRRVALKVLLGEPERWGHPEAAARMMREARAAAAFNHPNVVAIYDVGEFEGSPYIAMELVAGKTLRSVLVDGAAEITRDRKIAWLLDVARGLGAAHRAGLVHRDIKPENVMITTDDVVKILDFGVARQAEPLERGVDVSAPTVTPNLPSLTREGVSIGTPQYMAPEQLQAERVDGRADQFSWGVMAYEIVAGTLPWAGAQGAQMIAAILSKPVRPLAEVVPSVEPRLAAAIERALEKNRDARFATMEDLVFAIDGKARSARIVVSSSEPAVPTAKTEVESSGASRGATKPAPRSRLVAAIGAGALVLVGGGIAGARFVTPAPRVAASVPAPVHDAAPSEPVLRPGRPPANPAASAAFEAALQEERDGQMAKEYRDLTAAAEADPTLAAANMRIAYLLSLMRDFESAHDSYQKAVQHRAALGDLDAELLTALEPLMREPPNEDEFLTRIVAVSDHHPRELWPALLAGAAYDDARQLDKTEAYYDRILAADPNSTLGLFGKGTLAVRRGEVEQALKLFGECSRVSPSLECIVGRTNLYGAAGRCEDVKTEVRRAFAIDPGAIEFYDIMIPAAVGTGDSLETIREYALRASASALPADRATTTALEEEKVAELGGDFRAAIEATKRWDKALADEKHPPADATLTRIDIADETGTLPAHRAELLALWNRSVAWLPKGDALLMQISHREYEVGLITQSELAARREAWWSARIEQNPRESNGYLLWKEVYGKRVVTPDEAREALAHLSEAGAIPPDDENNPADQFFLGRAYALAGDYASALPFLRYATRSCSRDVGWIDRMRGFVFLGDALAQTGDIAGAREAYQKVIDAWGHATPRSLTATKARTKLAALAR